MLNLRCRFGRRLQTLRRVKHLTQVELANKTGVSANFISNLERGIDAPSFETLDAIASVLELPVKDLFDFEKLPDIS